MFDTIQPSFIVKILRKLRVKKKKSSSIKKGH